MKRHIKLRALLIAVPWIVSAAARSSAPEAERLMNRLPVAFERNQGQAAPDVRFLARRNGFRLLLRTNEIEVCFGYPAETLRMRFAGGAARDIVGEEALTGTTAVLQGSNPSGWISGIVNYSRVRYQDVYPGVDLVVYGSEGQLEYDWVVAPGADPALIRFWFEGAERTRIDTNGDLVLDRGARRVRHKKPLVYQEVERKKREIRGAYTIQARGMVTFKLGAYDRSRTLVIDPHLIYATSFGGYNTQGVPAWVTSGGGRGLGIAVDESGSAYVVGTTTDSDTFPRPNPIQPEPFSGGAFICKFTPDGSNFVYAVYFGGGGEARAVTLDREGNAYITGRAGARENSGFPQVGPLQPARNYHGIFVAKLNPQGNALVWSFIFGGGGRGTRAGFEPEDTSGNAIALDGAGNVYVAGSTVEPIFTTPRAFQTTRPAPPSQCPPSATNWADPSAWADVLGRRCGQN